MKKKDKKPKKEKPGVQPLADICDPNNPNDPHYGESGYYVKNGDGTCEWHPAT